VTEDSAPGSAWAGTAAALLPADGSAGALAGRVWDPAVNGPSVVAVREGDVWGVAEAFPTMRDLCELADPASALASAA
jgi:fumarylacetoacetate (FAA) hydrolase family protein